MDLKVGSGEPEGSPGAEQQGRGEAGKAATPPAASPQAPSAEQGRTVAQLWLLVACRDNLTAKKYSETLV